MNVAEFDDLLGNFLPELVPAVQAERAAGLNEDELRELASATSTFEVYGGAVMSVFPDFIREVSDPIDPQRLRQFVLFLTAWDSATDGRVRKNVMPLWLRVCFDELPQTLSYLTPELLERDAV